ncbi:hypothetical protein BOX15_Mlig020947g1, partial [Macrostomum lignano]
ANATVKILYSQYVACGIADYRESRLRGLQASLTSAGHTVCLERLEPSGLRDIVELWVNGERVFACPMLELDYGGDGQLDPLCEQAARAVLAAY